MPYPTKHSPQQMQQNLGTMKADIHHLAPRGCTCVKRVLIYGKWGLELGNILSRMHFGQKDLQQH